MTPGRTCFRGAPFCSSNTSLIGTSTLGSAGQVTIPDVLKIAEEQGKIDSLRIRASRGPNPASLFYVNLRT